MFSRLWAVLTLGCLAVSQIACGQSEPLPPDTIVATFGDEVLRLGEFEKEFQRSSNLSAAEEPDTPEEFLDRYVHYRLKVMAAEEAGLDNSPDIQDEIHMYRAAFARPYLVDRKVLAPILLDFYEKKKQLVHASHIFTGIRPELGPADSARAYLKIQALRDSVLSGVSFGDIAERNSEDPSAASPEAQQGYRGDLGWFTAGMMVKAFEDLAYTVPVGEVSEIFRTQYGFHILLVHDRKPAVPDITISQILVRINGAAPESLAVARERIEAAKARLDAGQNFAYVAAEASEETRSRTRGGDVGTLSYLMRGIDSTFKEIAFNMNDVGDVTDIVETGYGFQILKLTGRNHLGTYEEEFDNLKRQAQNLPRMIEAEAGLAEEARREYAASLDTLTLQALVGDIPRDSVRAHLAVLSADPVQANLTIAQVADSTYKARQLARFAADRNNRIRNAGDTREQTLLIGDAFLDHAAITHKALALEASDEEFAAIMREFRDGLLLFQLMEDSVWTASEADTAGVRAYYEAHKDRYEYPDRHRIMEVFSYDDSLHQDAVLHLDGGMSWTQFYRYIRQDTVMMIRFDTVLVAGPTNSVYDRVLELEPGEHSEVFTYSNGFAALYYDGIDPARPKSFEEARAEIISEYQTEVENQLLARLRSRYNVVTYPERVRSIRREN